MKPHRIYFYTASILHWKNALMNDDAKQIILDSLNFLVNDQSLKVHGYIIMPNHIHFMWTPLKGKRSIKVYEIHSSEIEILSSNLPANTA